MSAQITLTLPTDVFQQAEALARRAGRPVEEVLQETIELSLRPLGAPQAEPSLDGCSDEEILQGADLQMPPAEDQRLSELLHRQQAGSLEDSERSELNALMARSTSGSCFVRHRP